MSIVIDSHVLIWLLYRSSKLSDTGKEVLRTADAVYVSTASLWELAIKFTKKKLPYSPDELLLGISKLGLEQLPIRDAHIRKLPSIDLPHGDPFDRLLVAQSESEGCLFMTADSVILGSTHQTTPV